MEAADLVFQTRQKLARFFGAPDPDRVIFAANATDALNLTIQGIVGPGDHVVATRLEHNSVLRPLFHLTKQSGIAYDLVGFDEYGHIDPDEVAFQFGPVQYQRRYRSGAGSNGGYFVIPITLANRFYEVVVYGH